MTWPPGPFLPQRSHLGSRYGQRLVNLGSSEGLEKVTEEVGFWPRPHASGRRRSWTWAALRGHGGRLSEASTCTAVICLLGLYL